MISTSMNYKLMGGDMTVNDIDVHGSWDCRILRCACMIFLGSIYITGIDTRIQFDSIQSALDRMAISVSRYMDLHLRQ